MPTTWQVKDVAFTCSFYVQNITSMPLFLLPSSLWHTVCVCVPLICAKSFTWVVRSSMNVNRFILRHRSFWDIANVCTIHQRNLFLRLKCIERYMTPKEIQMHLCDTPFNLQRHDCACEAIIAPRWANRKAFSLDNFFFSIETTDTSFSNTTCGSNHSGTQSIIV